MGPPEVDQYLQHLASTQADYGHRITAIGRSFLDCPYQDGPLGEGPQGEFDKDPLMDLSKMDCVTYVEQTLALAVSTSYQNAHSQLQTIRYDHGHVSFETRNHFMVSDWLENNPWCRDITGELEVPVETVRRTIDRAGFFHKVNAPKVGQDTPPREVAVQYIQPAHAKAALQQISGPALIVFIGRKPDWLFALHCGLLLENPAEDTLKHLKDDSDHAKPNRSPAIADHPKKAGRLHHASSKAGKVVDVDLAQYLQQNENRYLGFAVYALDKPKMSR
jgi:D-alanyl-D-alanine carboxypeptidase/D-alanyl-D-alanine-endopeptidase (penicillin-binding protein 4)